MSSAVDNDNDWNLVNNSSRDDSILSEDHPSVRMMAKQMMTHWRRLREDQSYRQHYVQIREVGPEDIDWVLGKPIHVLERIALGISRVCAGGFHPDESALIDEVLGKDAVIAKWFLHEPVLSNVTEDQVNRDGSNMLCERGRARFERGLFAGALVMFERARDVDATNARAWFGIADCLQALGRTIEATKARLEGERLSGDVG